MIISTFLQSQLRIRIEMAFGIMQMKWAILNRPIGVNMTNVKWLAVAIARLHNFVINERIETSDEAPTSLSYLPSVPTDENGDPVPVDPFDRISRDFPGWSDVRERMADRIKQKKLERPPGNRIVRE
jgi:hypothetical protein